MLLEEDEQIYAYTRTTEDDQVVVITNLSTESAIFKSEVKLDQEQLLLNNYPVKQEVQDSIVLTAI